MVNLFRKGQHRLLVTRSLRDLAVTETAKGSLEKKEQPRSE